MPNVKEKTMVEHYRTNYNLDLDYLVVIKHDLKGETIKPIKDIKITKELTLEAYLNALETRLHLLEETDKVYKEELARTNTELQELKLVFENTIKELITRWVN